MFSNKSFTLKFSKVILSTQVVILILTFKSNITKLPKGNLVMLD